MNNTQPTSKYLENLHPVAINSHKAVIVAQSILHEDDEDAEAWTTDVGKQYVAMHGYKSDYDTFFGIGSSIMRALIPQRGTPEWDNFWNGNFETENR